MFRAEIGDIFLARLLLQPKPALVDCLLQPQGAHVQVTHLSYAAAGRIPLAALTSIMTRGSRVKAKSLAIAFLQEHAMRFSLPHKIHFPRCSSQSRSGSCCCSPADAIPPVRRARALAGVRAARPVGVAVPVNGVLSGLPIKAHHHSRSVDQIADQALQRRPVVLSRRAHPARQLLARELDVRSVLSQVGSPHHHGPIERLALVVQQLTRGRQAILCGRCPHSRCRDSLGVHLQSCLFHQDLDMSRVGLQLDPLDPV